MPLAWNIAWLVTIYSVLTRKPGKLWDFRGQLGGTNRISKKGVASTPAFLDGRVFVRGKSGLYALDANTGELLWQRRQDEDANMQLGFGMAPADASVIALNVGDGTDEADEAIVLLKNKGEMRQTIALNVGDGGTRWQLPAIGAGNIGIPGRWQTADGTELLLLTGNGDRDTKGPVNTLLPSATDGSIVWSSPHLGMSDGPIRVDNDIVLGMIVPESDVSHIK